MFEKFIEYGLHDTYVNDIILGKNGLTFSFCNGVYILDDTGKETCLSKPCKMKIFVQDFESNRLFEHCTFYKCYKKRYLEVDLSHIKDLLKETHFAIDLDFYSPFAQAISLQGHIGKYMIEIRITEIKNIEFEI